MTADVRIIAAEVTPVAIPMRGTLHHSDGEIPPWQVRHIVRLRTDAGVTGVGEASPRTTAASLRDAAGRLVGEDPFNHERVRLRTCSEKFYRMDLAAAAAALQMACLDIQGRCTGRPVADLLGGRLRERVPVIAYLFRKADDGHHEHPEDALVAEARRLVDQYGFQTLKYKAGAVPPEQDLAAASRLRELFPGHRLRIDPNGAWGVATAIRIGRQLAELDLEWVEDPTLGLEGMTEFTRRVPIPTATNMCCIQPREFAATVAARAVNVILLDLWYLGGPWSARQMATACRIFDLGVGIHAGGGSAETGIGVAAEAHLAASLPGLVHAMDTMHHELTDDIVVPGGWKYDDGFLVLPDAPGLGVELDEDKLRKYAEQYDQLATSGLRPEYPGDVLHPSYPRY